MAAGVVIKHKRKSGAFTNGELQAGEMGLDVSAGEWWFSTNGTTVQKITVSGVGDMLKSVYDSNDDGKVNASVSADSVAWSGVTGKPTFGTASGLNTGTTNGTIPVIGAGDKLPTSLFPSITLTDLFTVANQAAQLALTAEEGDVAIRTDEGKTYIHNGGSAGTMADWSVMPAIGVIQSVNGQTGVVVLGKADIGLGNVPNVDTSNAANITSGSLATAQMTTNIVAALDTATAGTVDNSDLIMDGGTI